MLSGDTASNVKSFEGLPLSSYTMGTCEEIFQVLEAEAWQTPTIFFEEIMISKGEVINLTKCTKPFTGLAPEEMSLSKGGET